MNVIRTLGPGAEGRIIGPGAGGRINLIAEEITLLYKINYNIFELHYSLQKEPKLPKKGATKCSKTRSKNENKNLS